MQWFRKTKTKSKIWGHLTEEERDGSLSVESVVSLMSGKVTLKYTMLPKIAHFIEYYL